MSNTPPESSTSSSAAVVIIIAALVLLGLPCLLIIAGVSGFMILKSEPPRQLPIATEPPRRIAPVETAMPVPFQASMPANGTITVNNIQSSQNLFDDADRILTVAKYEQVRLGMTYDQLLVVLEIPENRRPSDMELVGPESDVELKWFGGTNDALSITIKLKGKTVVGKAQTGLK